MDKQIQEAIEYLEDFQDSKLCEKLIREKGIQDPAFAEAAFKQNYYFHAHVMYKDASEELRDKLIDMLEQKEIDTLDVNGILLALSAIGDEKVVTYFKKWEANPPAWREKLYVGPARYAEEGGWCIEDGKKKDLTFEECYALEELDELEEEDRKDYTEEKNVRGGVSKDKCPYCGSSYVNFLIIDGRDERLSFLGIHGKIKVKFCDCCLPWEDFIYCKYTEDGESEVINQVGGSGEFADDEDLNWGLEKPLILSKKRVPKHYCTEWNHNVIGGAPTFVDDAKYAACPECKKKMKHLAQINEDYTTCGSIYVQICTDCKIIATTYQQS